MQRLEDDRWMLTLAGILGDHPPTDPDGFVEFARSLPFPDIWEAIRDAEPLDDPVAFRFPASVRHRYERLRRFPAGLLVTGDALCSFNPIYGQGMTVAALEALTLRRHLASGVEPQPRRWFRDLARVVDVPWQMAAGGDLLFPDVQGRRTRKIRLLGAYLTRLHAAAAHDAHLAAAFLRVAGLVSPPQSLLRPGVALRVLAAHRTRTEPPTVASRPSTRPNGPHRSDRSNLTASNHRSDHQGGNHATHRDQVLRAGVHRRRTQRDHPRRRRTPWCPSRVKPSDRIPGSSSKRYESGNWGIGGHALGLPDVRALQGPKPDRRRFGLTRNAEGAAESRTLTGVDRQEGWVLTGSVSMRLSTRRRISLRIGRTGSRVDRRGRRGPSPRSACRAGLGSSPSPTRC